MGLVSVINIATIFEILNVIYLLVRFFRNVKTKKVQIQIERTRNDLIQKLKNIISSLKLLMKFFFVHCYTRQCVNQQTNSKKRKVIIVPLLFVINSFIEINQYYKEEKPLSDDCENSYVT